MIFSLDKGMYTAVLLGEKTLTTRVRLPAHIAVGKEWAIVPKRAAPAWWLGAQDGQVIPDVGDWVFAQGRDFFAQVRTEGHSYIVDYLKAHGFVQARIRIDAFWQTPLQRMTHTEATQEGVGTLYDYQQLWDSINKAKGLRWDDNPQVWRIRFSLPQDVCIAVSKVGRAAILTATAAKGEPA